MTAEDIIATIIETTPPRLCLRWAMDTGDVSFVGEWRDFQPSTREAIMEVSLWLNRGELYTLIQEYVDPRGGIDGHYYYKKK